MSQPWMPLYVSDFLADTSHLDAAESGAYMLLIMHYWQRGSLPSEDRFLARIARMTDRQWAKAKPTISAFFDAEWTHNRINSEMEKAERKSEARAVCGSRGGSAKALKDKDATVAKATISPEQNDSKQVAKAIASSSQPQEQSSLRSDCSAADAPKPKRASPKTSLAEDAQPGEADAEFARQAGMDSRQFREEWQQFRDHHLKNGNRMADWPAAWRTWVRNAGKFQPRAGPAHVPPQNDRRVYLGVAQQKQAIDEYFNRIGDEHEPLAIGRR